MAKHTFIFRISWFLQILTGVALISLLISFQSHAQPPDDWGPVSIGLEEIEYPHPVSYMSFSVQGKDVRMAYMDVPPVGSANGQTVVLLHGLNFFGEYWDDTIEALTQAHRHYKIHILQGLYLIGSTLKSVWTPFPFPGK